MSETSFFGDMFDVVQRTLGTLTGADPATFEPVTVTIGTTAGIPAQVVKVIYDQLVVAGGKSNRVRTFVLMVSLADCPGGTVPEDNTPIETSDGDSGVVLFIVKEPGGLLTITAGSPLTIDRRSSLMQ